jgi:hypothetical protein
MYNVVFLWDVDAFMCSTCWINIPARIVEMGVPITKV